MEERQADCELQLRIGLDHDVGGLPTRRPGGTCSDSRRLEAGRLELADAAERRLLVGPPRGIDAIRGESLEPAGRRALIVRSGDDHACAL